MDPFDNIEKWYRDQVENLSQQPDKNLWNSLDEDLSELQPGVEEWYKSQVEKQATPPDSAVWNELSSRIAPSIPVEEWHKKSIDDIELEPSESIIENIFHSLDVDNVWDKLETSLYHRDRFIWWRNFTVSSLSGIALIILGFFLLPNYFNYSLPVIKETTGTSSNRINNFNQAPQFNQKTVKNNIHATNRSNTLSANVSTTTNHPNYQINHTDNRVSQESTGNTTTPVPGAHKTEKFESTTTINPTIFHPVIKGEIDHIIDQPDLNKNESKRPIFLLAGVGVNQSFLLNENTFEALSINSTDYNQAVASSIVFIGFGLPLNDQLTMEASISKLSTGHHYMLYREGKSIDHKLQLKYLQGSVLFKLDRKNNYPVWNGKSLLGAYYGYMTSESSEVNEEEQEDQISFNKNDYGLIVGYEIEKQLPLLNVGISLSYAQGLSNILNENSNLNYSFDQTLNSGLNAKVQISLPIR